MPIEGLPEFLNKLTEMVAKADEAGKKVVQRSEVVFEAAVKESFTEAHKRGTPSPAAKGAPPAVVSGTLRRSFVSTPPEKSGIGWSGRTFPTTVYARIQELGGQAGRGHATHIPARPYMAPALAKVLPALREIHTTEFNAALRG